MGKKKNCNKESKNKKNHTQFGTLHTYERTLHINVNIEKSDEFKLK